MKRGFIYREFLPLAAILGLASGLFNACHLPTLGTVAFIAACVCFVISLLIEF
jgi:hypothetical protein